MIGAHQQNAWLARSFLLNTLRLVLGSSRTRSPQDAHQQQNECTQQMFHDTTSRSCCCALGSSRSTALHTSSTLTDCIHVHCSQVRILPRKKQGWLAG